MKATPDEAVEKKKVPRTLAMVSTFHYKREVAKLSTEILKPWLYLGNATNAGDYTQMHLKGFTMTHCLNCRMNGKKPHKDVTYNVLSLVNEPSEDIIKQLKLAIPFIQNVRDKGGDAKILVHCDDKIKGDKDVDIPQYILSRSSAILIGYLMKKEKMSYKKALAYVNKKRAEMFQKPVLPNHGFVQQLKKMEKLLNLA